MSLGQGVLSSNQNWFGTSKDGIRRANKPQEGNECKERERACHLVRYFIFFQSPSARKDVRNASARRGKGERWGFWCAFIQSERH